MQVCDTVVTDLSSNGRSFIDSKTVNSEKYFKSILCDAVKLTVE